MNPRRHPRLAIALAMAACLLAGLAIGSTRTTPLHAAGADRWQERIVATGPIGVEVNNQGKQVERDEVSYLNYPNGMLLA